ncbi:MAG: response regulator transcription factor [Lachnospiraceae bacterium]|mgnify:FL=1|nr:response regulator transcription factor [Lachnospiraceae bacterium]MDE6989482.1 LytTR family DNA-binding domain-containing protein [Lachnospiraceae bacterium]MDE7001116.1 LytTR family DNA-binding domain-containing protein [Lachnospiraceae bacterium]
MRIAICDDEEVQRLLLQRYVQEWALDSKVEVETRLFASGESFWFAWEDDRAYDLLVFDIEMGQLSGMELAAEIRRKDEDIPILFVTGYDSYMAQGFEVAALHYLLKPLRREKLFAVLDKYNKMRLRRAPEEKILFRSEEGPLSLPASKIWYIEAMAHQCVLYTEDTSHVLCSSIGEMARQLCSRKEFVRCHRSFLVNVRHISAIVKPELVLDDRRRIPVSRSAEKTVSQVFIEWYKG